MITMVEVCFFPFIKVGKDHVLPHLMTYAADKMEFYRGNIYLDKKIVPLKSNNSSFVNYSKPMDYYKSIRPIKSLVDPKKKAKTLSKIKEGDIVYFIPEYYTGGTDFKTTPVGLIPGGLVNFAILNSILTNSWVKPAKFSVLYLLLGATLGSIIALNTGAVGVITSLVGVLAFWVGLCLYLFSYHSIVMPMMLPMGAFVATLLRIFVERVREKDKKSRYIHQALEGVVKPNEAKILPWV